MESKHKPSNNYLALLFLTIMTTKISDLKWTPNKESMTLTCEYKKSIYEGQEPISIENLERVFDMALMTHSIEVRQFLAELNTMNTFIPA
jgi:hypothetical protein